MSQIKKIRQRSEDIRESNKELAIKNVEQAPRFNELKSELVLKASELASLREEYDKKYKELSESKSRAK